MNDEHKLIYSPNYFECKWAIERLKRFQDLIRHDKGYADQVRYARSLVELIPELIKTKKIDEHWIIEREINRLIPIIQNDLHLAHIETLITHKTSDLEYDDEKGVHKPKERKSSYNLIRDYFELPNKHEFFEMIIKSVERGIGWYLGRERNAFIEIFNPLSWLAFFIRVPIIIIQKAGIETSNKVVAESYAWLIKIIMLILLIFIATKLGISIPWSILPH